MTNYSAGYEAGNLRLERYNGLEFITIQLDLWLFDGDIATFVIPPHLENKPPILFEAELHSINKTRQTHPN
jgi:hypothetical protein